MIRFFVISFTFLFPALTFAKLYPGFNPKEYQTLLEISARHSDTPWTNVVLPYPSKYELAYRSTEGPLDNRWDLWIGPDKTLVLSIRGTTADNRSWAENFYAGLLPAKGIIRWKNRVFPYQLAADSNASVHAGWTLGLATMAPEICSLLKEKQQQGYQHLYIMGHSQGGALAFLLRSYLHYAPDSIFPKTFTIKTYCSAAPKPGNLYYSYDFAQINQGGWAYRVVNPRDWVPETPVAVQALYDLNRENPFAGEFKFTRSMRGPLKWFTNFKFNRLARKSRNTQQIYTRSLGEQIRKTLINPQFEGLEMPALRPSSFFVPAGDCIALPVLPVYEKVFPANSSVFIHHLPDAYYFLLRENYLK